MNYTEKKFSIQDILKLSSLKDKIIVIKYGGSIMDNEKAQVAFIEDLQLLTYLGAKVVIVHGGGPEISKWLNKTNIESKFIKGLRVTDNSTMEIAEMVLSGNINKKLSSNLSKNNLNAIGISGKDSSLIKSKKKYLYENGNEIDIGFVGEVTDINTKVILKLLESSLIPVISPIGTDSDGNSYNINADSAAAFIGSALQAEMLLVMTDINGVYLDINNPSSLIESLTVEEIKKLTKQGFITGGMLPKLESCINALSGGVKSVQLIDGRIEHNLIAELLLCSGTKFIFEREDIICQERV